MAHVAETWLRGKLLVAAPILREPTFARAVVALLEHGEDGAVGVVINRPGEAALIEVIPRVADLASNPAVLFSGGPVQPAAAIALGVVATGATAAAGDGAGDAAWRPIVPPLVTVDLDVDPTVLTALRELRVFAGYAGWAPGQLEGEIAQGAWYVVESLPSDPFAAEPERLWSTVLRRQPWPLSAVSTCPLDPTMN